MSHWLQFACMTWKGRPDDDLQYVERFVTYGMLEIVVSAVIEKVPNA